METYRLKGKTINEYSSVQTQVGVPTGDVNEMSDYSSLSDTDTRFFAKWGDAANSGTKLAPMYSIQGAIDQATLDGVANVACIDTSAGNIYDEKIILGGKNLVCVDYKYFIIKPSVNKTVDGNMSYKINSIKDSLASTDNGVRILPTNTEPHWGTITTYSRSWSCTAYGYVPNTGYYVTGNNTHFFFEKSTGLILEDRQIWQQRPNTDDVYSALVIFGKLYMVSAAGLEIFNGISFTTDVDVTDVASYANELYVSKANVITRIADNVDTDYAHESTISKLLYATDAGIYFLDISNVVYFRSFNYGTTTLIAEGEYTVYEMVGDVWVRSIDDKGYIYQDGAWQLIGDGTYFGYARTSYVSDLLEYVYHDEYYLSGLSTSYAKLYTEIVTGSNNIEGCIIDGSYRNKGIYSAGTENKLIRYINLINCGIALKSPTASAGETHNNIIYNSIIDNNTVGVDAYDAHRAKMCKNIISNNRIGFSYNYGVNNLGGTELDNNTFIGNELAWSQLYWIYGSTEGRSNYNNIFVNNQYLTNDYHGMTFNNSVIYNTKILDQVLDLIVDCYYLAPMMDSDYRLISEAQGYSITSRYFKGEIDEGYGSVTQGAYADDAQTITSSVIPFDITLDSAPDKVQRILASVNYNKTFSQLGEMYQYYQGISENIKLVWNADTASSFWETQYKELINIYQNYEVVRFGVDSGTGFSSYLELTGITGTDGDCVAISAVSLVANEYQNYYIQINGDDYRIVSHTGGTSITLVLSSTTPFSADTGNVLYRLLRIDKSQQLDVSPVLGVQASPVTGYTLSTYLIKDGGDNID